MFQGKDIDLFALMSAIGMLCAVLAIALWLFACVRMLRNHDKQRGDWISVASFGIQLGLLAALMLASRIYREGSTPFLEWAVILALGTVVVLTFASLASSLSSSEMIRARMVPSCILWIFAMMLAIGVPNV